MPPRPSRIHELPNDLIARIAAGEVVERPASVVKELIENSLDAGATNIALVIEGAGRNRIMISDNGSGMTREEAHLSLRRHATSKIKQYEDLEAMATYGFRGEAIPSIASVSRFRMVTRVAEEEMGWELVLEGGQLISEKPVAREPGTTIDVRDLFFNTPARFKFLKSDATERAQCLRVLEEMVFSSLQVTFHSRVEGAKDVVMAALNDGAALHHDKRLRSRVTEAWGSRWTRGLQTVFAATPHFKVWGLTTDPDHHQATPRTQFLYVNNRPVLHRRLTRAIYDGYRGQLPSMRHPAWVLFLEVDPKAVDVNVHPAKREVKITYENEIFGFLVQAVREALSDVKQIPAEMFRPMAMPVISAAPAGVKEPVRELYRPLDMVRPSPLGEPVRPAGGEVPQGEGGMSSLRAVAQVGRAYIVAESSEGIVLIDQHAAQEKVIYEKLFANLKVKAPETQMLLVPFSWEVSLSMAGFLKEHTAKLQEMGFVIEPFGGPTFLVKSYPRALGEKFDLHSLLDGLSDVFGETTDFHHKVAAMTACKAAVKAGDALSLQECQYLLEQLPVLESPFTCPHGRPTLIRLPYSDLERRFRRT